MVVDKWGIIRKVCHAQK